MVLDTQRDKADPILSPIAKRLPNTDPNLISWIGLLLALACGVIFYFSGKKGMEYLLLVGSAVVLLSGFFDALDGKVAKMHGKASKRGDYLDHVFDRYADVFMIGGIAVSSWCNPYLGMLALVGVLLTSYMGTQAQAVGAPRLYSGLLGRADRVILTFVFPIVQFVFCNVCNGDHAWLSLIVGDFAITVSWMEIMMLWFAVVGNITAVQRAIITWNNMKKAERDSSIRGRNHALRDPELLMVIVVRSKRSSRKYRYTVRRIF